MNIVEAVAGLTTGNADREGREGEAIRVVLEALRDPDATNTLAAAVRAELGTIPASQLGAYRSMFDCTVAEMLGTVKTPTDTEMLNWLIRGGYVPGNWRQATSQEIRAGRCQPNGMILIGPGSRATIAEAMGRKKPT